MGIIHFLEVVIALEKKLTAYMSRLKSKLFFTIRAGAVPLLGF